MNISATNMSIAQSNSCNIRFTVNMKLFIEIMYYLLYYMQYAISHNPVSFPGLIQRQARQWQ